MIEDEHLMEIVRCIPLSQPKPNLFFASMHYLVSRSSSTLRNYYPSLTDNALPIENSFDSFKQFAVAHKKQLYDFNQS
ncbi:DUF2332 family protein [Bacillus sp. JJ722]|uniref:DUF2332 family protein n=1 Tax=Bacillus sp. JJ722 TaxID=3122973 RepID=UPI003F68A5C8